MNIDEWRSLAPQPPLWLAVGQLTPKVFFSLLLYSYISRILSSLARQSCCHKLNFPYILIHNRRITLHHILRLSQTNGCVLPHVHPTLHSPAETS